MNRDPLDVRFGPAVDGGWCVTFATVEDERVALFVPGPGLADAFRQAGDHLERLLANLANDDKLPAVQAWLRERGL